MVVPTEPDRLLPAVSERDHYQGSLTAKITLVEYGDYQCPDCQRADQIIQRMQRQWGDQLRFVFRHFPQSMLHAEAFHAAEAAEAAAAQNKFWQMHSLLLQHPSQLSDGYLVEYAIALHLDVNQFLAEMAEDCHMAHVEADIASGVQSGVTQTPTFFINGLKYTPSQPLDALLETVAQACSG